MCIPLRIDQGLGWVFDTLMALELYQLLWQAPSLFTFSMASFGRGVPLGTPETANPRIIPVGVGSGVGEARRKGCVSFLLCSLEWGTTLSRDHHPRGPFVPLQGCRLAGRLQAAMGFPVCRKQVWFLLSFWLYSHLNSNQHFLKLGARQGLLCFCPGNPWG